MKVLLNYVFAFTKYTENHWLLKEAMQSEIQYHCSNFLYGILSALLTTNLKLTAIFIQ